MNDMKLLTVICDELDKIADKGLTTNNLETAYKLIDMYKDLNTVMAMGEEYGDYSEYSMDYDGDSSYARGRGRNAKRDSMGRYSREDGRMYSRNDADMRYSQAKMDYRNSRAGKSEVMQSLNDKMMELKKELQVMSRDSDFPEERQTIDKYVRMIESVM